MNNFIVKSHDVAKLENYALDFLIKLFCNHEYNENCKECLIIKKKEKYNIFYIGDFKSVIKKEQFLEIINLFSFSNEQIDEKKFLIVQGFEYSTTSAQNLLLTWLENTYENIILIFLTSNYNKIITTIKSRLFFLDLDSSVQDYSLNKSEQYLIELILSNNYDNFILLSDSLIKQDKNNLIILLNKIAISILKIKYKNNFQIANYISKLIYQLESNIITNKKVLIEKTLINIFDHNIKEV